MRVEPFLAKIMNHLRGYIKSTRQSRMTETVRSAWILKHTAPFYLETLGISVEYTVDGIGHS